MREIKFRAWDKLKNEMVVGEYYNLVSFEGDVYQFSLGKLLKEKQFELMQFTGLKDKNGKEIYEGDIVKDIDKPLRIDLVDVIEWNSEEACFMAGDYGAGQFSRIEVIGNIYGNPELIERDTRCCGSPPDESGLCPICREHIN